MRSIRIISRISAILIGVLSFLPTIISADISEDKISVVNVICRDLILLLEIIVFVALFAKSEKNSTVKRCSFIALVGLFLCLGTFTIEIPSLLKMKPSEVGNWIVIVSCFNMVGTFVLSIAVLSFTYNFYSIKTLSFWGGIFFVIGFIVKEIMFVFCFFNIIEINAHNYIIYNQISYIFGIISEIGIVLFFYGLTSNIKRNG